MSNKSWMENARDKFNAGYEKEDRKLSAQNAGKSTSELVSEGIRQGGVEGLANPIRWVASALDD